MTPHKLFRVMLVAVTAPLALGSCSHHASASDADRDWAITGGDAGNSRYSTLAQVTRENVGGLEAAWVYHTGEGAGRPGSGAQMQATPIVVHGVLFSTSAAGKAFALRADNGTELWRFDPTPIFLRRTASIEGWCTGSTVPNGASSFPRHRGSMHWTRQPACPFRASARTGGSTWPGDWGETARGNRSSPPARA